VPQKKVVVLGSGKIGKLVAFMLAESGDYEVTAVDLDLSAAEAAIRLPSGKTLARAKAAAADFSDAASLRKVIEGQHYVLSCAPYHTNTTIAAVAKECGVHYLDLTEDVATTKAVKALSQGADVAFIPQCGLAPGYITIVAAHLGAQFDELESVKMRVGALPTYPHNKMKYNLTWSTEGLINEYGNPCEAVENGQLSIVRPLEGHEVFSFDGVEYEAFNTSGGLGTLAETWAGKVQSLDYKSVRYPGHREILLLLMNELKLNQDRATLRRIFENALPYTKQDVVLVFVTATGKKDGRYLQRSYAKKIYNQVIGGEEWGAIQITTASGLCGVLDLHVQGLLPKTGFVRQEDVSFEAFIANRFGHYYA